MAGEESDAADPAAVALEAEAAGDGGGAAELGFSFNIIGNTPYNTAESLCPNTKMKCIRQTFDGKTTTKFLSLILYSLRAVSSSRILPKKKRKTIL